MFQASMARVYEQRKVKHASCKKVNKREPVYGKLVGTRSVMDNYAGCGSSCNSHNIG